MPRGYYLGQGLIPLGYSSSDDEEGPCTLPNGRIVCGPHGLDVCGKCCTDYSLMNQDILDDGEDGESDDIDSDMDDDSDSKSPIRGISASVSRWKIKGTGKVFPTRFVPPASPTMPTEVFDGRHRHINFTRHFRWDAKGNAMVLIMTDGACLNNGKPDPRAGWGFFHGIGPEEQCLITTGRLEDKGPWGDAGLQTSNRAELRAIIAASRFRNWPGEGFSTIVFATDSSYVVEGATRWARAWVQNGWKTRNGDDVKNKDMWQLLLGECERWHDEGVGIQFWQIPREWNTLADEGAKKGAAMDRCETFVDILGLAC